MITNNMLLNLNRNMQKMSKLEQMMATGKKIQVPSDNPIIAARALKLRTSVFESKQYMENVKQAQSWIDVTEQAMNNIGDILDRARELVGQAATGTLKSDDRIAINQELKQLREQLVQEGNVSYAGRYVFSGFKTDQKLVFDKDYTHNQPYHILEKFSAGNIQKVSTVGQDAYRLRLGYGNMDALTGITIKSGGTATPLTVDPTPRQSTAPDAYKPAPGTVHWIQDTGELIFGEDVKNAITNGASIEVEYEKTHFQKGDVNPVHYFGIVDSFAPGDVGAIGNDMQLKLDQKPIREGSVIGLTIGGVAVDPSKIKYAKSTDKAPTLANDEVLVYTDTGSLKFPEGGIYAVGAAVEIGGLQTQTNPQAEKIQYEIGVNNKITVNTLGSNVLTADLFRDLDEMIRLIDGGENPVEYESSVPVTGTGTYRTASLTYKPIESVQTIKIGNTLYSRENMIFVTSDDPQAEVTEPGKIKILTDTGRIILHEDEVGAETQIGVTYSSPVNSSEVSKKISTMLTKMDNHQKILSREQADLGSRYNRLELTHNRLEADFINFSELMSLNENADITEVIISLNSQEMVYKASLMASAKMLQPTLMDFLR